MKFKVTKEELNTFMLSQHTLAADARVEFIELLKTPIILEGELVEEDLSADTFCDPMGVSKWRAHGKRHGYFDYFKEPPHSIEEMDNDIAKTDIEWMLQYKLNELIKAFNITNNTK